MPMSVKERQLAEDGDSWQQEFYPRLESWWPSYETFWRRYVVPMTYRVIEPENPFVRPGVPAVLREIGNADYVAFHHVAQMVAWRDRLEQWALDRARGGTEVLYCFFAHASSAIDSAFAFAEAIDALTERLEDRRTFLVSPHPKKRYRHYAGGLGSAAADKAWDAHCKQVKDLRNVLIHNAPIFVQSSTMPRLDLDALDKLEGLSEIVLLATDPTREEKLYQATASESLDPFIEGTASQFEHVWKTAVDALEPIRATHIEPMLQRELEDNEPVSLQTIRGKRIW